MSHVRIEVFSFPPRGGNRRISDSTVEESLAHDELRDLLHAAGVERPERAILEGGPVYDGPIINEISWRITEVCEDHWHCDPGLSAHVCDRDRRVPCPSCGEAPTEGR